MSTTTRVGFVAPVVSDFADEILYYVNNITTYEAELPSQVVGSLPSSGNYAGRIKVINNPVLIIGSTPQQPYDEHIYTGSAWVPYSSAGLKRAWSHNNSSDGSSVTSSGSEVFGPVMPNFSQIDVQVGSIVKFMCSMTLADDVTAAGNPGFGFNGKFNIFVNPNSSSQPTPLQVGTVRLSFPILESDNVYTNGKLDGGLDHFTGDLLYVSSYAGTIGVGAYLSCTYSELGNNFYLHDASTDTGVSPSPIPFNTVQILTEVAGTWSG